MRCLARKRVGALYRAATRPASAGADGRIGHVRLPVGASDPPSDRRREHGVPRPVAVPRRRRRPPGAATRRCGSCARPVAACPSTGPCAARAPSSTPSSSPTWRPRSRCSPCAATASTPPSCTATSSCRPRRRLRHRRRPGHRPGRRPRRCAARPTSTACRRSSPPTSPTSPRPSSSRRRRAGRRRAGAGLRRRPVHRGQLPDRGPPEPHLRAHQGADAHRRGAVARRDASASPTWRSTFIDVQLATAPAPSSCSTRGPARCPSRLRALRPARTRSRVFAELAARHPGVPGIHFGIGCDHLLESMCGRRSDRHRARLAHADRRRPPAARPRHRRAGQPRSGPRARRRRGRARRAPAPCSPTTAAIPATSSTSATACSPTPTPTCWRPSSSSCTTGDGGDDGRRPARGSASC